MKSSSPEVSVVTAAAGTAAGAGLASFFPEVATAIPTAVVSKVATESY